MSQRETGIPHAERRLVRRRLAKGMPFGIVYLGTILFSLLLIFACALVQGKTQRASQNALSDAGAHWAVPRVSGRWVRLEGTPPNAVAAARAKQAVEQARAKSLFGRGIQPTWVTTNFTGHDTGAAGDENNNDTTRPEWAYQVTRRMLRLTGDVPDAETKMAILEAAQLAIRPDGILGVTDELTVTGLTAPPGHLNLALRGIGLLSGCTDGQARFENDRFSFSCTAPEGDVVGLRTRAEAELPYGTLGSIDVRAASANPMRLTQPALDAEITVCEQTLADLLGVTRIRFETNSAIIGPDNDDLLDRVAVATEQCPGVLRIEGHTDDTGTFELNDRLAAARANAVRAELIARGVPAARLLAEGLGSRRPVASNQTENGRSQNRRIEIKVVRQTPER